MFVVSVIWEQRAWPLYWQFLSHQGSSNLATQQALLRPVLRLLRGYELVVVGDREFRSVELAYWLKQKKVYFALRQKQGSYIKLRGQQYQKLSELALSPGMKLFFTGVKFTKKKGFGQFCLAASPFFDEEKSQSGRVRCTSPSLPLSSDYHYRERGGERVHSQ